MRFLLPAFFVIAISSMVSAQEPPPLPPDQQLPPDQPPIVQILPPAPTVVYVPVPYLVPFAVFVPVPRTPGAHHFANRPMLPPPPSQGIFVTAPATGIFAGTPATGIFVTPPPKR